ncbi:MAG: hypothetical protein R3C12_17145 [Planctomycetaceae bacterium]|nr:hypothetical protein [Planctomycetaceae bacterium]
MQKLYLNDAEVCTSSLTQRAYRAACCEFLVCVMPGNQQSALRAFQEFPHSFSGLRVSGIADLSFLADFPNLRYLEVVDQKKINTRYLDGLSNLRGLKLETPGAGLDFSCFPELEVFVGDWHADNANVRGCSELRQLRAWHFKPKSRDLRDVANPTRLEWLALTQTDVVSLDGLENCEDLRYFEIAYAPQLKSLDAFARGVLEVREVSLGHAKKIESYAPLAAPSHLRRLKLSDCAPMPDLKWTNGMSRLDIFSFVNTNVEDGDLSPLLQLPGLRYVGTMDKKHYNYKFDAINKLLAQREG